MTQWARPMLGSSTRTVVDLVYYYYYYYFYYHYYYYYFYYHYYYYYYYLRRRDRYMVSGAVSDALRAPHVAEESPEGSTPAHTRGM